MSVNAQDWNATNSGSLPVGTVLLDNDYAKVTTAVQESATAVIKDETDKNDPKTYAGFTFTKYVNIRVQDAPAAANEWLGSAYSDCDPVGISLVVEAKQNTDVTLYYKHGDGKQLSCYDQTASKNVSNDEKAVDGLDQYYTGTFKFIANHKYTIYAKGGTTGLNGITTAAGTYEEGGEASGTVVISWNDEPALTSMTTEEMANTGTANNVATWDNGISIMIMRSDKGQSNGSNITVDGTSYKTIKVSNGAQNKMTLPEGKVTKKVVFYSYVNKDSATDRPSFWKEVNGVTYDESTIFASYKDMENPDKREFTFDSAVNAVTFTNTGEQCCYIVFVDIESGSAGITSAKAEIVNGASYNLAGQKVATGYKGIAVKDGKKMLMK